MTMKFMSGATHKFYSYLTCVPYDIGNQMVGQFLLYGLCKNCCKSKGEACWNAISHY